MSYSGLTTSASALHDGRELTEAIEAQEFELEGDLRAVERYLAMFWLPPTASMPAAEEGHDMKASS